MTTVEQVTAVPASKAREAWCPKHLGLAALLLYGCLNATLYVSLMPLWEGFDEPFHYGYVQSLSRWHALPAIGRTPLPAEVEESLALAPASHIVQRNLPGARSFAEYFALPADARRSLHAQLDRLVMNSPPPAGGGMNYEAQQPPLAYALLAPADRLWANVPLPVRIWRLRLLAALFAVLVTGAFTWLLAGELSIGRPWREIAVFLVLSSQMFYATTAHIANDWLAVPLMAAFGWAAVRFALRPEPRRAATCGLILAAGLLAKASFLALLPVAAGLLLTRRPRSLRNAAALALALLPALPWYARNLVLYHRLSGLIEPPGGAGASVLLKAAWQLDWLRADAVLLRSSCWMGNNSNLMLSGTTVNLMLALLAAGALLYLRRVHRRGCAAEGPVLAALAWFAAGLAYATVLNFVQCEGVAASAAPWYAFGVVPWLACLLVLGLADGGTFGRVIASLAVLAWAYVMCITFWLKLIPLYAGYTDRVLIARLLAWYRSSGPLIAERLRDVSLIGPAAIYWLAVLAAISAVVIAAVLVRLIWKGRRCVL